ncbi:hypothetical protein GCM10027187_51060 [Streptosporangium sandarakinum]|uniref:Uncharacterized protein n=1 Tax=Streptosporangium sandarakinum TaxID=1260955 RepID=A0A852V4K7_9ACTN|nr:hypothetical protein [Streptosporangium sandarakinum]NYF40845.1 hypothetical protein [Streptosporangium sandarakinum]
MRNAATDSLLEAAGQDASDGYGQTQVASGATGASGGWRAFLQELKEDPGPLRLETLPAEIVKLERVKAIGLPAALSEGVSGLEQQRNGQSR